ncbi:unnamed protein product [Closterium sp. Naga37s-1]|nr:unnamed protein product [Closterium sp. Naga37s-1]
MRTNKPLQPLELQKQHKARHRTPVSSPCCHQTPSSCFNPPSSPPPPPPSPPNPLPPLLSFLPKPYIPTPAFPTPAFPTPAFPNTRLPHARLAHTRPPYARLSHAPPPHAHLPHAHPPHSRLSHAPTFATLGTFVFPPFFLPPPRPPPLPFLPRLYIPHIPPGASLSRAPISAMLGAILACLQCLAQPWHVSPSLSKVPSAQPWHVCHAPFPPSPPQFPFPPQTLHSAHLALHPPSPCPYYLHAWHNLGMFVTRFPPALPTSPFLPKPCIPHISPCTHLPHAPTISATLGAIIAAPHPPSLLPPNSPLPIPRFLSFPLPSSPFRNKPFIPHISPCARLPHFPVLPKPYIPHVSPCARLPHAPISATLGATLGD